MERSGLFGGAVICGNDWYVPAPSKEPPIIRHAGRMLLPEVIWSRHVKICLICIYHAGINPRKLACRSTDHAGKGNGKCQQTDIDVKEDDRSYPRMAGMMDQTYQ